MHFKGTSTVKSRESRNAALKAQHCYIVNRYKVYNSKNSNELRTYMSGSRGVGGRGVPILSVFTTQAKE